MQDASSAGRGRRYLLGRRRKARLTIALGTAALTGGLGGAAGRLLGKAGGGALPGELLAKLGPEVGQITEMVRGGGQGDLEDTLDELGESWAGRVELSLLGPMAPYDFVTTLTGEG